MSAIAAKVLIGLGLLVALAGAYIGWRYEEQQIGAAKVEAADAAAVIAQQKADAALSAKLVADQAAKLQALEAKANTDLQRINDAPKTSGCGPVMRDASHSVHDLLLGSSKPATGR